MRKTAPKNDCELVSVHIYVKKEMMDMVDKSIKEKFVHKNRTTWILQAIYDKLEKEGKL